MPSYIQSGTIEGYVLCDSAADYKTTSKIGYLVKIHATQTNNFRPTVTLAAAETDLCPFVIVDTPSTSTVICQPLTPNRNVYLIAGGAITAGNACGVIAGGKVGPTLNSRDAAIGFAENAAAGTDDWVAVRPVGGFYNT